MLPLSWANSSLMENLVTTRKGVGVNLLLGNQIWGLPEDFIPPLTKVETLRKAFSMAAALHSKYWRSTELFKKPFLNNVTFYQGKERSRWEKGMQVLRERWELAKKTKVEGFEISEELRQIVDKSFQNTTWDKFQAHLKDEKTPWTLCHGDFHGSNMFCCEGVDQDKDDLDFVMIDWSEVGPFEPTLDISQMVVSDVPPELLKEHSRELVEFYWHELKKGGVDEESWTVEDCWKAFCRTGAEKWIVFLPLLFTLNLPAVACKYFHDQTLSFIRNHDPQPYYTLKPVICF